MVKVPIAVFVVLVAAVLFLAFTRLGDESRAMLVGSLCGIFASIQVTVVMALANTRFTRPAAVPSSKPPVVQGAVVVRCKHDTPLMEMPCSVCEREGIRYLPAGPQTWD